MTNILIKKHIMLSMRDDVRLEADVYRLEGSTLALGV